MSMVRVNDNIKEDIMPILNDLGLYLSEAINLFLHQIKLNNGLPFNLKRSAYPFILWNSVFSNMRGYVAFKYSINLSYSSNEDFE